MRFIHRGNGEYADNDLTADRIWITFPKGEGERPEALIGGKGSVKKCEKGHHPSTRRG